MQVAQRIPMRLASSLLGLLLVASWPAEATAQSPAPWPRYEQRSELDVAAGGLGLFALSYTPMLAAATIGSSEATKECGSVPRSACPNALAPLFVPVVGPFWMLGRLGDIPANTKDVAAVALFIDGMAQGIGLVGIGYGLVPHAVLVKTDRTEIALTPHGAGLGLSGTF